MGCNRASYYISTWYDEPVYFHGMYWRMVGGNSTTGKIAQLDMNKNEIQRIAIKECATAIFRTGHRVYLTNSNGRTCYISVYPPLPKPLVLENFQTSVIDNNEGSGLVKVSFQITGDGSKTCEISWGNVEVSHYSVNKGSHAFARVMTSGTHQICARLI